jgi:serine/threonine-protein kinase RsbW
MSTPAAPLPRSGEAVFEARLERLHALLGWVEAACAAAGLGEDVAFPLQLAVEEVAANVINHGYAGGAPGSAPGPLRLAFHADDRQAAVVVEDEAPAFDPADAPAPDLDGSWEERRVGGLGWHLVYQMVDEVRYEALPGRGNRITLVKHRAPDGA